MPPSNSSCIQQNYECTPISSNCIIWQGSDIAFLSLRTGDTISDVIFKLATIVENIKNDSDLSEIDFSCLISSCSLCPQPEKTVKAIIELLTQKVCYLEANMGGHTVTESVLPTINLGCLSYTNTLGDTITTAKLDEALKLQITKFCQYKSIVDSNVNTISNHETRISTLEAKENDNVIPKVTSAGIFTGLKDIDDAYELLDADYVAFKSMIGTVSELNSAFSKVCTGLNAKFGTIEGWTPTPTKLAHYFGNMIIMACNHEDRIKYMETTCCGSSCDDIVIGFIPTFINNTVVLSFTAGSGLVIPTGFTDCGSELIISDDKKDVTYIVPIEANNDSEALDISQFEKGTELTFTYNVKMCSEGQSCQKCYIKQVKYTTDCCVITNTGDQDVTIIYETLVTSTT